MDSLKSSNLKALNTTDLSATRTTNSLEFNNTTLEVPGWITSKFKPKSSDVLFPTYSNCTWILTGKQIRIDQQIRWQVNNISYKFPQKKTILAHASQNTLATLPIETQPYVVGAGDVVDIILQNFQSLNGVCEAHPWHLHGHSFYVLGYGPGKYTIDSNAQNSSVWFDHPIRRDTVALYPFSLLLNTEEKGYCGWTKLRVVFDNVGAWPFHWYFIVNQSHIVSHFAMGMGIVVVVGKEKLKDVFVGPDLVGNSAE